MGAVRYPQLRDRAWLQREYVDRLRSTTEIADQVGCKAATVSSALQHYGIPRRPRCAPYGPGHRRRLRVKRDVRSQAARDRQRELVYSAALPGRLRAVSYANRTQDPQMLRNALIELAALCEIWATLIPQKRDKTAACACERPIEQEDHSCARCGHSVMPAR